MAATYSAYEGSAMHAQLADHLRGHPLHELQQLTARGAPAAYHDLSAGGMHFQPSLPAPALPPLGHALGHAGAGSLRNVNDLLHLALANGGLQAQILKSPICSHLVQKYTWGTDFCRISGSPLRRTFPFSPKRCCAGSPHSLSSL